MSKTLIYFLIEKLFPRLVASGEFIHSFYRSSCTQDQGLASHTHARTHIYINLRFNITYMNLNIQSCTFHKRKEKIFRRWNNLFPFINQELLEPEKSHSILRSQILESWWDWARRWISVISFWYIKHPYFVWYLYSWNIVGYI